MSEENEPIVPPVKEGDILKEQEVINSGKKNDGVVKYENYIIFVNDCTKGDIVSFQIEKVLKNFGIGKQLEEDSDNDDNNDFNCAMDGIESMILAHAVAGIDVDSPAYIEGIETAVDACANNL